MKSIDWQRIEKIIIDALELTSSEREKFLDSACAGKPELRAEIESLLACETEAENFLRVPAAAYSDGLFSANEHTSDSLVGKIIGNYKIISELGQGGMGAVYLVERDDDDFRKLFAIKLLKRELNTAGIRRRFHRERQILASLEHPNITRLIDVGTTGDGVPFFIMEYVNGTPVNDFCRHLPLADTLKLFRQICSAVAFAHHNLIVHRDLKSSNILITADGTPKLLDFGISKLLSPEFKDETAHTITNLGAMTPEYASPEQIRGETITTSSDIYSLGVILYELLTGHRPFEFKKQNSEEIIQAVCQTAPEKPSAVITHGSLFERTRQGSPQTNPQYEFRNPKSIRGDLDNIVLTALRKEPERRYGTVEQFAEDIERHSQGLPVKARPNTFSYRAGKFIKRNYPSVIAAFLLLIILFGGIAATFWQARRAERQRLLAEQQQERAQKRFNDVRGLANSFLFEIYPQIENLEGATEAREALVKRALEYLDSLSQESGDDAGLQRELAAAYERVADVQGNPNRSNLGDRKGALASCQKAQALREALVTRNPADANLRHELAANYEQTGVILWWSDETEKAVELYEKALSLRRTLIAENPNLVEYQKGLAELQINYGDVPAWNKESEKALAHYREAQRILENLAAANSDDIKIKADLGAALTRIGRTLKDVEEFDQANAALDQAQQIFSRLRNENPNEFDFGRGLWKVRFSQCETFLVKPDNQRAVETCKQTIELAENLLKKDSRDTLMKHDLVSSYNYAGDAFLQADMYNEAIVEFQKALAVNEELAAQFPESSEYKRNIAIINLDLGKTNLYLNKTTFALENNQKAQKLLEEIAAEDPQNSVPRFNLATADQQLGETYLRQRNTPEARNWFIRALEILQNLNSQGLLALRDKELISKMQRYIAQAK